jgi:alpha-tubulin suppressor-like RCC1 family protein
VTIGKVYCWGYNNAGQLGNGSAGPTAYSTTPVPVADGAMGNSGVTAVAAGYGHTCALKSGQVYCWGRNVVGDLGDGTTTDRTTPTLVADGAMGNSGVTAVAAGYGHTLGLKDTTCLFAWGANDYGQLGDGTTTNRTTPVQVSGWWGITPRVFIPCIGRNRRQERCGGDAVRCPDRDREGAMEWVSSPLFAVLAAWGAASHCLTLSPCAR